MIYNKLKQMREKQYSESKQKWEKFQEDAMEPQLSWELSENVMAMKTFVDSDALKTPTLNIKSLIK